MTGARNLTSKDIAILSGVSQSTVSRVIRGLPVVKPELQERVNRVLAETGFVPNAAARNMRTRMSSALGVVVARVTDPFHPELLEALAEAIRVREHVMSVWLSDSAQANHASSERAALDALQQGTVDGILYTTARRSSPALRLALERRAPLVMVNRTIERAPCDKVSTDNVYGGRLAAEHLLACGYERLAMVNGPLEISSAREREEGFRQALEEAGKPLRDEHSLHGRLGYDTGFEAVNQLFDGSRNRLSTGLFCGNDIIAFGAIDAARKLGLKVPQQLGAIGFDDIRMSQWGAYSLTTVRQPIAEMARIGTDFLLQRVGGTAPKQFRHTRLAAQLVVRESTLA
jgi:LacI family transcriptional regulator